MGDPVDNVAQHISQLEQLSNKMKALGEEVLGTMLITRILSTLPPKFSHFHSGWDSTKALKKTLENLIARLVTEALCYKSKKEETEEATVALFFKAKIHKESSKKMEPADKKKYKSRGKNALHVECRTIRQRTVKTVMCVG